MKKTKLQQAFELFVGNDELRPMMHKPFLSDGYLCATDAHALISTGLGNLDFEIENKHKPPSVNFLFTPNNQNIIIDVDKSFFDKFKTADEMIEDGEDVKCDECEGEGVVDWEYQEWEKEFDCPKCDGNGLLEESKLIPSGNKTFEKDDRVLVFGAYLSPELFCKLIEVKELLGGEIKLVFTGSNSQHVTFEVANCIVFIMPISESEGKNVIFEVK